MEYFLIGFLTAFGWWTASKVTDELDKQYFAPPSVVIEQVIKKEQ